MRFAFLFAAAVFAGSAAAQSPVAAQEAQAAAMASAAPLLVDAKPGQVCETARWGLVPSDFSLLDTVALRAKVAKGGHVASLRKVRKDADACSLYLAALQAREDEDDERDENLADRAAELGLLRALTEKAIRDVYGDNPAQAFEVLRRHGKAGNAFSAYWHGQMLMLTYSGKETAGEAVKALTFSAYAGFAPAQLWLARRALEAAGQTGNAEAKQIGEWLLAKAVAQGNEQAVKFAKERARK